MCHNLTTCSPTLEYGDIGRDSPYLCGSMFLRRGDKERESCTHKLVYLDLIEFIPRVSYGCVHEVYIELRAMPVRYEYCDTGLYLKICLCYFEYL